mmetsp:Transcript_26509/g.69711  ORF Transcript_26509/g.69711 Transcript_26509/m.69711 type:complete len:227 (-) Transcript_26509:49-729(-)
MTKQKFHTMRPQRHRRQKQAKMSNPLFFGIRSVSIVRYLSFGGRRMPLSATAKYVPQIVPVLRDFHRHSFELWESAMHDHNRILARGEKLGLCRFVKVQSLTFSGVDDFILKVHAPKIISVLESLSGFAETVLQLMREDEFAPSWWFDRRVLIYRGEWIKLSRRVMDLVKQLKSFDTVIKLDDRDDLLVCALERVSSLYAGFADSVFCVQHSSDGVLGSSRGQVLH